MKEVSLWRLKILSRICINKCLKLTPPLPLLFYEKLVHKHPRKRFFKNLVFICKYFEEDYHMSVFEETFKTSVIYIVKYISVKYIVYAPHTYTYIPIIADVSQS